MSSGPTLTPEVIQMLVSSITQNGKTQFPNWKASVSLMQFLEPSRVFLLEFLFRGTEAYSAEHSYGRVALLRFHIS